MIKSIFAATAALSVSAGAAVAGPYVNVEANAGWTGDDYTGSVTDIHVAYEGALGDTGASYYVQGASRSWPGTVLTPRLSSLVKQVLAVPVTDAIGVYGEVSFLTTDDSDDLGVGGKLGVKYSF